MSGRPEPTGPRSLSPREHGAYGQLFVPIVAALAMGRPTVSAIAIAIAGPAVFFAHEPLLVLVGRRGERARRESGARARARLVVLGTIAVLAAAAAAMSAPTGALIAAAAPLPLGLLVGWLAVRGKEKTTAGELLAAGALAGVAVPVAIAAGVGWPATLGAWGAWVAAFGASTWAVRAVIAHRKEPVAAAIRVLPLGLPIGAAVTLAALGLVPWFCAIAAAPMTLVAIAIAASPPHPRALKRVGWSLVAASVAAAGILIAGARLTVA